MSELEGKAITLFESGLSLSEALECDDIDVVAMHRPTECVAMA